MKRVLLTIMFGLNSLAFSAESEPSANYDAQSSDDKQIEVTTIDMPAMKVAFLEHVGPYSGKNQWDQLSTWAKKNALESTYLGLYYDNPQFVEASKLRSDICIVVDGNFSTSDDPLIKIKELSSRKYAKSIHSGEYKNFYKTYASIFALLSKNNAKIDFTSPVMEIYLNDPNKTAPDQLLTEIYIPLLNYTQTD